MEHLIALQDINDTIKAGDRFEAPDLIYVALGFAAIAIAQSSSPDGAPGLAGLEIVTGLTGKDGAVGPIGERGLLETVPEAAPPTPPRRRGGRWRQSS